MSIWDDVRWDHGDAAAAGAALRRAAAELRRTAAERGRAALSATAEWRGGHRVTFDEYLRRILGEAEELARQFESAAARIARASEQARAEQCRREREREREREERRLAGM
jgi:hypothetical protein